MQQGGLMMGGPTQGGLMTGGPTHIDRGTTSNSKFELLYIIDLC